MKKSLIFITVISLLITLFIPNIALAQELCDLSVKLGCAGEKTTITGTVTGWKGVEGATEVDIFLGIENMDTGWVYYFPIITNTIEDEDPFVGSFSINLVAGNYIGEMNSFTWDGVSEYYDYYCDDTIEFVVVECPAPEPEPIIPEPEPEPIIPEPEPEPIIPEPCYCSLIVQIRDEGGHPINGAKLKVDGIEKKTVNGDARWDNLNCDTSYEVREISPEKRTEGIHLGDCGERSTLRIVNKIEKVEVVVEEVIIPEAGLDFNFTTLYTIAGLGILRILLGIERKRK